VRRVAPAEGELGMRSTVKMLYTVSTRSGTRTGSSPVARQHGGGDLRSHNEQLGDESGCMGAAGICFTR
jgi:hypothetical protein